MRKTTVNEAARLLNAQRWKDKTPEERAATASHAAKAQRDERRCFCGANTMWRAALRRFECCRKEGVVVLNKPKKEKHDEAA